jgi:hypothetical protein
MEPVPHGCIADLQCTAFAVTESKICCTVHFLAVVIFFKEFENVHRHYFQYANDLHFRSNGMQHALIIVHDGGVKTYYATSS